ncbi:MAG: hypothetical protein A2Y41_02495 [Spirochaetes bacterium GWB1_36_13]|nr:MAG: hypothetical protein A2Y41_02495 [Spirochaetes bacterium GWB1_36_13]
MTVKIKLNDPVYKMLEKLSKEDKTTVENYIQIAVYEKMSSLNALSYIEERAKKAKIEDFEKLLKKVPSIQPLEGDEKD